MSEETARQVPITDRALIQRINRRLAHEGRHGEMLRATRGDRWRGELGDYYIVDLDRNAIIAQHVNPEELGRELGVLKPWETVVWPEGGQQA